jgi:hypothetical protein
VKSIDTILRQLTFDELLDLLVDLSGRFPDVRQHIVETAHRQLFQ